jgi:hypothetical protein
LEYVKYLLDIFDKSELFWYGKRGYQEGRMAALWDQGFFRSARGRIVMLLRRSVRTVLTELTGLPIHEHCGRDESSPRCCFEVANPQAAEGE